MLSRILILIFAVSFTSLLNFDKYLISGQSKLNPNDMQLLQLQLDSIIKTGDRYFNMGFSDEARKQYIIYMDILKQNFPNDKLKLANIYIKLGVISSMFWKFKDANELYIKAEKLCEKNKMNFKETLGRINISRGKIYKRLGEYDKAREYYSAALSLFKSANISDFTYNSKFVSIIHVYNSLGVLNFEQKKYKDAVDFYKKCEDLSKTYYKIFLPVTYENLADCYYKLKIYDQAKKYFKLSIKHHLSGKAQDFKYLLANVYSSYSQLCIETGQYDKACGLLNNAYKIYIKHWGPNHPQTSECLVNFGRYYEATGNIDSALHYYQLSINCLTEDFNDLNIYNNPGTGKVISSLHLIKTLKQKAKAFSECYRQTNRIKDLEASLNTHDVAIQLIDKIRMGYQTQESKLFLSENEKSTYIDAIYTAYILWQTTGENKYMYQAFKYAEKSKAAVLLGALRNTEAKSYSDIPDSLLQRETELMRDKELYRELVYEEKRNETSDERKIKLWEELLFEITMEYDKLIALYEDSFPKYYSLKYNSEVADIETLKQKLKNNQAIVEYSISETSLFIFLLEKTGMNIFYKPLDSTFHRSLNTIIGILQKYDFSKSSIDDFLSFVKNSNYLYDCLIKPVDDCTESKKLIIVPDELLSFLPFESLLINNNNISRKNYRDLNYLINKYIVSYALSSTLCFREITPVNTRRIKKLSAFAPAYENPINTNEILTMTRQQYRKELYPIAGVKDEVYNISKIVESDIFEGYQATEAIFKDTARYYDILHLSMHTIIDNINPMFSKLAFTNDNDSIEDGLLNTYEIYNMNLSARLAVLSSCSSGEGILQKGEGVMSLARAFIYAGCPSIIMTLWVIEDKSGVKLMTEFYRELAKGRPKDEALRNAKLKFIKEANLTRAHPFYWSAYICVGNPRPLFIAGKNLYIIIVSLVVIVTILFLIKKILRKKAVHDSADKSWYKV